MSGTRVRRLAAAMMALAFLASGARAQTGTPRALTVDDIVSSEAFGRASISPDERWAIYEKRGPYDTAPRFDLGPRSQWRTTDLWLVDLKDPGAAPVRLAPGQGPGLLRGPWSPTGARLLIYRIRDETLEVGIVTLVDRSVRWSGLTPEMPQTGAAAEWVSDERVVLMTRPDATLPLLLRYYRASQTAVVEAWTRTATGKTASRTVMNAEAGAAWPDQAVPDQALVALDVTSGGVRTLARGALRDFALAPDGRRLALVRAGERVPVVADAIIQMDVPTRQKLSLVTLADGAETAVAADDVAPHLLRWSSDSRGLLVWSRTDGKAWSEGRLLRVDQGGLVRVVPSGDLAVRPEGVEIDTLRGVQADWMGNTPVLYGRPAGASRFDWYALQSEGPRNLTASLTVPPSRVAAADTGALYFFGDGAFWSATLEGLKRLSTPDEPVSEVVIGDIEKPFRLKMNDAPRQDWAAAVVQGMTAIASGQGVDKVLDASGSSDVARPLAASRHAALVLRNHGMVETLSLRNTDGEQYLDRVNGALADVVLTAPEALDHKDAFGRPTRSWLFLPGKTFEGPLRGVVVDVYPGSVDAGAWSGPFTLTYGLRAAVLAGAGFAVLSPSIPVDRKDTTSADYYARSVDAAVDAALEAHPDLPRDRIAIVGHSFGGYTALAIATRSRRYRSYVSWAGMTEMFSDWGEFIPVTRLLAEDRHMMRNQQGWIETGQGGISGPPWKEPAAYIASSPLLFADRISAPVMLITADRDYVPMSQAELMFSALYRLGARARLVTYWGEDHSLWSPANIRDLYRQIFDWLDLTLNAPPAVKPPEPDALPRPEPSLQRPPPP